MSPALAPIRTTQRTTPQRTAIPQAPTQRSRCRLAPVAALAAALLFVPSTATAAPETPEQSAAMQADATPPPVRSDTQKAPIQFVDMAEMLIDGRTVKPLGVHIDARQKVRFERLIRLERPVLPRLRETASDTALR